MEKTNLVNVLKGNTKKLLVVAGGVLVGVVAALALKKHETNEEMVRPCFMDIDDVRDPEVEAELQEEQKEEDCE